MKKYITLIMLMLKDADIDTIILGCTHYPLLMSSIVKNLPDGEVNR